MIEPLFYVNSRFLMKQILFSAYALALPLSLNVANGLLVLILVYSLVSLATKTHRPSKIAIQSALLFISFFVIQVIALTYTNDTLSGTWELLNKSGLFVFPLILVAFPPLSRKIFERVLLCFVAGCLITGSICFVASLINYYRIGAVSWLSYSWLSKQMDFHPAYLSLYMCFSFFIIIYMLVQHWKTYQVWIKIIGIIALLFCSYMIIMLGARLVGVTFFGLLFTSFLIWMQQKKLLLLGTLVISLLALTLWSLMSSFFVTRYRMNKIVGIQTHNYEHNFFLNINDPRGQIWESSFEALQKMPLWGYGIADEVERVLMPIYISKKYETPIDLKANTHNQFLQTLLATGYLGLLILLSNLLITLYLSWRKKMYLYTLFLLLMLIPMLTESMLEVAHGVLFFAFFNSLCYSFMLNREKS